MVRFVLAAVLLVPAVAFAAGDLFTNGDAAAGEKDVTTCVQCHGPGGNGSMSPTFPKLANQGSAYLFEQLQEFKANTRKNAVMNIQAAPLSEQQMRDIAAYFSAQAFVPGTASEASVAVAQPLYRGGDPARGVPACAACHGPAGEGNVAAAYPRIGGQNSAYVAAQLSAYKAGTRGAANAKGKIMQQIAAKLTDDEIQALSSYVSGLH
ncbi:MAG: cytochrome c4 [Nevskiaceae bacterium]|nr:MAG: cytochrome c4 [Nevskiaceae bacterium]TBR72605.1 MAG: cytochrome c4 [Nevskiaceae bacterium]